MQCEVVTADLGKGCVAYTDKRGLAFDQEKRQRVARKYHDIGTLGQSVVLHPGFDGEQGFWITVMFDQ
ncbi:hypothetical protein D3C86_1823570 [compost metagenome]